MVTSREKVKRIFERKNTSEKAFWTGHPNHLTVPLFAEEWKIEPSNEAIYAYLGDDCRHFAADGAYRHPEGLPLFDVSHNIHKSATLASAGCFAETETIAEIERHPWPDPKYCDFSGIYDQIEKYPDKMVFTGVWSAFFHVAADYFGMENYFIKMYENPKIVEAVTEKIVDYYVAANEKFFGGLGDRADIMFFANDFGTQRDLFISPRNFERFIFPSLKRLTAIGKKYNKKIMMHSCGSVYRIIPYLIEAGIDGLHPIQAQAAGMSALDLAQYKNDLAFVGGIDAQSFLCDATPRQVEDEVCRVRDILGPNIVISPSHEEILPNVPAANILAMSKAAH